MADVPDIAVLLPPVPDEVTEDSDAMIEAEVTHRDTLSPPLHYVDRIRQQQTGDIRQVRGRLPDWMQGSRDQEWVKGHKGRKGKPSLAAAGHVNMMNSLSGMPGYHQPVCYLSGRFTTAR